MIPGENPWIPRRRGRAGGGVIPRVDLLMVSSGRRDGILEIKFPNEGPEWTKPR